MPHKIEINDTRYSRLEIIPWWDKEVMSRAKIMVAGCGAIGNEVIKNLSMLGAGNLFLADMDKVEKSNLTRSILFEEEDEGSYKAECAARRAKEINPEINVSFFNGNIFQAGLGIFNDMDIIIGGLDNREARFFINQSCRRVNKPWIDGAIEILSGVARVFMPEGACYECTMSAKDYELMNKRKSCLLLGMDEIEQGKVPTTPTSASIIAGVQVQEAVKLLHKREGLMPLNGKGFVYNGVSCESYLVEYPENPDCASHYTFTNIQNINKNFDKVTLNDISNIAQRRFGDKFNILFNNEVIYFTLDAKTQFKNMNLVKSDEITSSNGLIPFKSFNKLSSGNSLLNEYSENTLSRLNLPINDIITITSGEEEVSLNFLPSPFFTKVE